MNKKITLLIIGLSIIIVAAWVIFRLSTSMDFLGRKPNPYEYFYESVAVDAGEPSICKKISKLSYIVAAWNAPSDKRASLLRTACFSSIAINTKNAALCDQVIPIHTFFYDGNGYSPTACRVAITSTLSQTGGVFIPFNDLRQYLQEMGYTEDTILKETHSQYAQTDPGVIELQYRDFYLNHKKTSDFLERIKKLPSFD